MQHKQQFTITKTAICILALTTLTILLASLSLVQDTAFFHKEFQKHDVQAKLQTTSIHNIHDQTINLLLNNKNITASFYSQREISHLNDVQNIINQGKSLIAVATLIIVIYLFILISQKISNVHAKHLALILMFSALLTFLFIAIVGIGILLDFSSSFTIFHKLLFQDGTWIFNPRIEKIVVLYPQALFMNAGIEISKRILLTSLSLLLIGITFWKRNGSTFK